MTVDFVAVNFAHHISTVTPHPTILSVNGEVTTTTAQIAVGTTTEPGSEAAIPPAA